MNETQDMAMVQIDALFLQTLMQIGNAAGFTAVQRVFNKDEGMLWFVREETTKPDAWLRYKFDDEGVAFAAQSREDFGEHSRVQMRCEYAAGIDAFLSAFNRVLTGNRLAHKEAA